MAFSYKTFADLLSESRLCLCSAHFSLNLTTHEWVVRFIISLPLERDFSVGVVLTLISPNYQYPKPPLYYKRFTFEISSYGVFSF